MDLQYFARKYIPLYSLYPRLEVLFYHLTITTFIITMSTQAQPPSSPAKRTEHSIETHSMALAFWLKGDSYRSIGKQLGLSHTTVQGIISKFQITGSIKNQTRC